MANHGGVAPDAIKPEPIEPRAPRRRLRVRLIIKCLLYLLTAASALLSGGALLSDGEMPSSVSESLLVGAPYALAMLSIVAAHCGAHYWCAIHFGVEADPPWVFPGIGSLSGIGGFIDTLPDTARSQKVRTHIGLIGPAAGALVSSVFVAVGMEWSHVGPSEGGLTLGEPLIFQLLTHLIVGPVPENQVVYIHPVGLAGWFGLMWSAVHLVPIEPMDGGYLVRAIFRPYTRWIASGTLLALIVLGITVNLAWFILFFFLGLGVMLRRRLPSVYAFLFWRRPFSDDTDLEQDLQNREKLIALAVAAVLFLLCVAINPIQ